MFTVYTRMVGVLTGRGGGKGRGGEGCLSNMSITEHDWDPGTPLDPGSHLTIL